MCCTEALSRRLRWNKGSGSHLCYLLGWFKWNYVGINVGWQSMGSGLGSLGCVWALWTQSCCWQVSIADETLLGWCCGSWALAWLFFQAKGEWKLFLHQVSLVFFPCFGWMCWWIRLIFLYRAYRAVFCPFILLSHFNLFQTLLFCCWPINFSPHPPFSTEILPCSAVLAAMYLTYLYGSLTRFATCTILWLCVGPFFGLIFVWVSMCLKSISARRVSIPQSFSAKLQLWMLFHLPLFLPH